jgi:large subunit ribosomal protein L28
MARRCELTGKGGQVGHKVSHSNRKTKKVFRPNLVNVTLASEQLKKTLKLRISANALRTVEHRGGLDAFLIKADAADLSRDALAMKKELEKARTAA